MQAAAAKVSKFIENELDEAPSSDSEAAAVAVAPSPLDVRKEAAMEAQTPGEKTSSRHLRFEL